MEKSSCVITDVEMRQMSGPWNCFTTSTTAGGSLPVVIITGKPSEKANRSILKREQSVSSVNRLTAMLCWTFSREFVKDNSGIYRRRQKVFRRPREVQPCILAGNRLVDLHVLQSH